MTVAQRLQAPETKSFLCSALIHGALFLGVGLMGAQAPTSPQGFNRHGGAVVIDVGLEDGSQARTKTLKATAAPARGDDGILISKTKSERALENSITGHELGNQPLSQASRLGSQDGIKGDGEIGTANGGQVSERQQYLYELRVLIEGRKVYPLQAKRLNEKGKVTVLFEILRDGKIDSVQLKGASHFARLNQAALTLVKEIEAYRPLPDAIPGEKLVVEIPIEYELSSL